MVVYAGPLKQRLGPLKARMKQYNGIAHRLLEAPSPNLKEMKLTKERLLQSTDTLEKINFQWASLISEQDRQDQDAWQKDYEAHAVGDDGFICILEQAKDYLAQLVVYLEDVKSPPQQIPTQNRGSSSQNIGQGNIQQNNVNLPKCNIPTFMGHKTEWPTFWSIFKVSVDENSTCTNSEKMAYLISSVSKKVEDEIRGYQLIDNGYESAIKHLKDRYGDPQFIKRALFKEIDHLPKAIKVPEVRKNWSELKRILLQLKNLGEDIESRSFIREVERKFGEWVIRETSKEELDFTGKWTAETMLENVDKIAKIREIAYIREIKFVR